MLHERRKLKINNNYVNANFFMFDKHDFPRVITFLLHDDRFQKEIKSYNIVKHINDANRSLFIIDNNLAFELFLRF